MVLLVSSDTHLHVSVVISLEYETKIDTEVKIVTCPKCKLCGFIEDSEEDYSYQCLHCKAAITGDHETCPKCGRSLAMTFKEPGEN